MFNLWLHEKTSGMWGGWSVCSSWKIAHKSIQYYCYGFAFFMYQYNSIGKEGVGWCVCGVCDIVAKMSWCSFTVVPPSFSLDSDMSFFCLVFSHWLRTQRTQNQSASSSNTVRWDWVYRHQFPSLPFLKQASGRVMKEWGRMQTAWCWELSVHFLAWVSHWQRLPTIVVVRSLQEMGENNNDSNNHFVFVKHWYSWSPCTLQIWLNAIRYSTDWLNFTVPWGNLFGSCKTQQNIKKWCVSVYIKEYNFCC